MGLQSLYDNYRLNNSTQIPQYLGSTGDAAIKVATMRQGMYDTAQTTAGELGSMSQNALAMDIDNGLKNELVSKVQGRIGEWSGRGDWENNVEAVRGLGREYVQRAKELAAPVEQYQSWVRDELTNEKKGLTPDQIATLQAKRLAEYRGLKKDPTGKFVGSFNGGQVAENIDVNKFVDDAMSGAVYNIGGSEVANDNGIWKYKKGGTWNTFSDNEVKAILNNARNGSDKFKGYARQEAEMHAFKQERYVGKLDDLADVPKAEAMELIAAGIDEKTAVNKALQNSRVINITKTMDQYAIAKYAHNNRTSSSESAIGDVAKARILKADEEKSANLSAQLVETPLDNPAKNWDDLVTARGTSIQNQTAAGELIATTKAMVRNDYDKTHGAGSFDKLPAAAQEGNINIFYKRDPSGAGISKLADLARARETYGNEDKTLAKIKQADDQINSYAYQKLGKTKQEFEESKLTAFRSDLKNRFQESNSARGRANNLRATDADGKPISLTDAEAKQFIASGKMESTSRVERSNIDITLGNVLGAGFTKAGQDKVAAGKSVQKDVVKITLNGKSIFLNDLPKNSNSINVGSSYETMMSNFNKVKKEVATEALTNYSQSTMGVVTANKKFNDESRAVLMAGAKVLYDATGNELKAGDPDLEKKMQARISAGQFTLINHQVETKGQNSMMVVAVKDPEDPKAEPTIIRVGTNTTNPGYFGKILMKEAQKDGKIIDQSLYDAGAAMQDGSSYKKLINQKVGSPTEVKQYAGKDANGKPIWKSVVTVTKAPNKTLTLSDADGNPIIGPSGQPLHLEGQARIAAFLDNFKNNASFKIE